MLRFKNTWFLGKEKQIVSHTFGKNAHKHWAKTLCKMFFFFLFRKWAIWNVGFFFQFFFIVFWPTFFLGGGGRFAAISIFFFFFFFFSFLGLCESTYLCLAIGLSKSHTYACRYWDKPIFFSLALSLVKGPYADHILIPQGSTGSSIFFDIKWKPIFFWLQIKKFQLQILCSFGDITKSVKLNGTPENNFLCIFIIASSQGCILSFASGE